MVVFRIVHERWAVSLKSPGVAGRWNQKGSFVIYASASRSLACLENLVHRSYSDLLKPFRCMVIEIPTRVTIETARLGEWNGNWFDSHNLPFFQNIGEKWLRENQTCVLQVPSAIIPKEFNFVLNTEHADFKNIRILNTEVFAFDARFKSR
jgi:RES domain-containing protein